MSNNRQDIPIERILSDLVKQKVIIEERIAYFGNSEENDLNIAISNLLIACSYEIETLSTYYSTDLVSISASTRNIFEIYLILQNILYDTNELLNWWGQAYRDQMQVIGGFIVLLEKVNIDPSRLVGMKQKTEQEFKGSLYLKDTKTRNTRNLAEKFDRLYEYNALFKLCSKLMHPTSFKVNTGKELIQNTDYLNIVFTLGVTFVFEINALIAQFIAKNSS